MQRPNIELYIDDRLVEFQETPQVLFTYSHTDMENPTVVKNSFSKTITIDGTPQNNQIFGCFGDMTRILEYKDGKYTGAYFNPSRKVDFILIRNGEPMERGYVKLDRVVKKGNEIKYDITLFGGLGQMLYNLTYGDEGVELKLSDLKYDTDLNFKVNKETVKNAWNRINKIGDWQDGDLDIYDFVNFAPCYNGIPNDFSADRVAIHTDVYPNVWETSKEGYSTVNGWILGDLPKEYDEWQMKDLRSYLQRPVVRFKKIIDACCDPENNGGYTVDLDSEFFSSENPYWENAWLTLPFVNELKVDEIDVKIDAVDDGTGKFSLSNLEDGDIFDADIRYFVTSEANVPLQTNGYGYRLETGAYTFDRKTPLISANMAIYSQLVAYDANGRPVAGSNVVALSRKYGAIPSNFTYDLEYDAPVTFIDGSFVYMGDREAYRYRYWDNIELGQWVGGDYPTHLLRLEDVKYSEGMYLKFVTKIATIDNGTVTGKAGRLFWSEGYEAYDTAPLLSETWSGVGVMRTKREYNIDTKILLNTNDTPSSYFLNYIKMFNLHIYSDNVEKKVYVRQRKNFFTGEKENLNPFVDRGNEITITPIMFDAKWYVFNNEIDAQSYMNTYYKDKYGVDYGVKKIDTNYNFDNNAKDLIEKGVFKGVICQKGQSKYYKDIYLNDWSNTTPVPSFVLDGFSTLLFNSEGNTIEGKVITPKTGENAVNWGLNDKYDLFPKPDFREKGGKTIDGANVLLFFNGTQEMLNVEGGNMRFYISDDLPEFSTLNEGDPCWIMGGTTEYTTPIDNIPVFSRYLTNANGWITHSWDFGTPKELFIDGWSIDDSSNIYSKYWKSYLSDRLNVNTREVECWVYFREKVNPEYLQKFVYFDNCYWLINDIIDYDVTSNRTTKVRMIKINDIENYLS